MLFLFVLMLVGVDASDSVVETIRGQRRRSPSSPACCSALILVHRRSARSRSAPWSASTRPTTGGNIQALAQHPVLPLRLRLRGHQRAADHRGGRRDGARPPRAPDAQGDPGRAWPPQRMRDYAERGKHLGPLPPPGVFARHNAVDTPALLPDGTAGRGVGLPGARRPGHGPLRAGAGRRHRRACSASSAAPTERRPPCRARPGPRAPTEEDDRRDRALHRPLGDPVHHRLRRRAHPPQRDRGVHVRRADAQRLQPRAGRPSPSSTATSTARSRRSS